MRTIYQKSYSSIIKQITLLKFKQNVNILRPVDENNSKEF